MRCKNRDANTQAHGLTPAAIDTTEIFLKQIQHFSVQEATLFADHHFALPQRMPWDHTGHKSGAEESTSDSDLLQLEYLFEMEYEDIKKRIEEIQELILFQ